MTISRRIMLMLTIALSSLILIGIIGVWQLGLSQHRYDYVQSSTFPSIKTLIATRDALSDMRVQLLRHGMAPAAKKPAFEQAIAQQDQLVDKLLHDYETVNAVYGEADIQVLGADKEAQVAAADHQSLAADKAALANYRTLRQAYLASSRSGDLAATEAALIPLGQAGEQLSRALTQHQELNLQLAADLGEIGGTAYNEARILLIVWTVLASLVSLVLGVRLYRNIHGSLGNIQHALEKIEGSLDLTQRAEIINMDEVGHTATAFNRLLTRLQDNLKTILHGATEVTDAAQQLAQTSSQVSVASATQSESSASMAATVEQMTVSINHMAVRARDTLAQSTEAGERAQQGSGTIAQTIRDIREISETVSAAASSIREMDSYSAEVSSVVQVISDIADQTNLLALNAAIEAARAGESGRGFAVVADEVRKLAERTTKSTREISGTIDAMRQQSQQASSQMQAAEQLVEHGVSRADDADIAIRGIGEATTRAAGHVEEISTAIQQQGEASNNIAVQVERIAQMSEEASAAAQMTADNATRLDQLARQQISMLHQYTL